ncbi:type I-G CRISPR-associated protein Csb2 [Imhoffiella purpurea]|uniref:Type I-U CRISPR-associated protein Cas5/Cas6 n=1 Tax=Imhoffiella purpurea TaxID=1249627 RepID=W9V285_9GAMM|nr:type I-U CRISPR-associated protein Csb2 [Imhoffiella purpurea]EXJ13608.1 hypothetical protein D779_3500 [Imhoffiella purpurea]
MLGIRADFLRGVYVAAEPTAPTAPEWPPAPARLFAALVSAAYAIGLDPRPLSALEAPPRILFGTAIAAPGETHYVPPAFITAGERPGKAVHRPQMVDIDAPVLYLWDTDLDPAWLMPILEAVTYLGRAESTVRLSLAETVPDLPFRLNPDPFGDELLRVPGENWLRTLQEQHGSQQRILAPYIGYSDPRVQIAPSPWGDWFVLRPKGGELRDTARLGAALRKAAMHHAPDPLPAILHGHERTPHAAWLTLPHVGHEHADGRVLGLAMLLPREVSDEERTAAVWALSRVTHIQLADRRIMTHRPAGHEPEPQGIRRATWAGQGRVWTSVTPILLERHPRRGQSLGSMIADSCERWGYPRPTQVETTHQGRLRGVPPAPLFRPRLPGRWTHATLHWDRPIRGPLLLGRDQHVGLGLCRSVDRAKGG